MPSDKEEAAFKEKKASVVKKAPSTAPSTAEKKAARVQTAEGWKRSRLKENEK